MAVIIIFETRTDNNHSGTSSLITPFIASATNPNDIINQVPANFALNVRAIKSRPSVPQKLGEVLLVKASVIGAENAESNVSFAEGDSGGFATSRQEHWQLRLRV